MGVCMRVVSVFFILTPKLFIKGSHARWGIIYELGVCMATIFYPHRGGAFGTGLGPVSHPSTILGIIYTLEAYLPRERSCLHKRETIMK
jgi:hypothetical protein